MLDNLVKKINIIFFDFQFKNHGALLTAQLIKTLEKRYKSELSELTDLTLTLDYHDFNFKLKAIFKGKNVSFSTIFAETEEVRKLYDFRIENDAFLVLKKFILLN